jgi:hypothetical protein
MSGEEVPPHCGQQGDSKCGGKRKVLQQEVEQAGAKAHGSGLGNRLLPTGAVDDFRLELQ